MISHITKKDIALVEKLSKEHYPTKGLNTSVPKNEINELLELRRRLKVMSDFFKQKYEQDFGVLRSEHSTGNPVGRGGGLRRVWSGIFKGSDNKQYAAQISFVIDGLNGSLDVGFYFGRASSFRLDKDKRLKYEAELKKIGFLLSMALNNDNKLRKRYYDLFEIGFRAEIKDSVVSPEEWLSNASIDPTYSSVTIKICPNSFGYIDLESIDFYVALVIPLLGVIPEKVNNFMPSKRKMNALTPEQRAQKAERLAFIGLKGEEYIMDIERNKTAAWSNAEKRPPRHVSLESDNEGYDILSYEQDGTEIYIEVKTTTLDRKHPLGKTFFLSSSEYRFYETNKNKYRLYRVWDIFGTPSWEMVDLQKADLITDGYKVSIRK
ncbi:DUF3883 domain-containing protein [Filimonas effusa]|uniref:DUF3883 domain-containing protein n=1 Tax=Filimonas effusa TaxID=2508721 RepID=A0A4V1MAI6_9BACT|nr:DUF3883 domain-containing protein [Filimonas effusa]RXK86006.1 DUF3883 domain-containing protein [Filimonas effusa]